MSKPSGSDVMQYVLSKLGGSPCEPSANGHIWFFSTHALVLDTVLTSSHAIYTTWRQLWPTLNPVAFIYVPSRAICVQVFIPEKHLSKRFFLISTFQLQLGGTTTEGNQLLYCLVVLKTFIHMVLNQLKVITKSKNAVDSWVLVWNIFPACLRKKELHKNANTEYMS